MEIYLGDHVRGGHFASNEAKTSQVLACIGEVGRFSTLHFGHGDDAASAILVFWDNQTKEYGSPNGTGDFRDHISIILHYIWSEMGKACI